MADNNSVFITGIADGAIEDALQSLPAWANQETAKSIEGILQKTLNLQTDVLTKLAKSSGKGGAGGGPDTKKIKSELDQLGDSIGESIKQNDKDNKHNKEKNEQDKKDKKYWDSSKTSKEKILVLDALIIAVGTEVAKVFQQNVETFDNMNAAGITMMADMDGLSSGFDSLRNISAVTGVRFTELSAAMIKSSAAINNFGVGKFAKTVGMASVDMTQFGFSAKDSAELLGELLTMQQNTGNASQKTAEQTSKDLQHFGESIFKLSLATGMSRQAILANIDAISKSTEANLLASQIGEKSAEGMTTFLASFKDTNVANEMLTMMTDPAKSLNATFQDFAKSGLGNFGTQYQNFVQSLNNIPEEQRAMAYKNFVDNHRQELDAQKVHLKILAQNGSAEAQASLKRIADMERAAAAIKKLTPQEIKRQEASNKASKALSNAIEKLETVFYSLFAPTEGMLDIFTAIVTTIASPLDALGAALRWVTHLLDPLFSALGMTTEQIEMLHVPFEYLMKGFNALGDMAGSVVKEFAPWIGLGLIGLAVFKGADLLKGALGSITKHLKGFMPGGKSGVGGIAEGAAGGKGGGLLGGLGKGIGDIGKGFGKGIKGILTGLADGLKMLGSTDVLKGVLALIGISAALWITSKAMKEFNTVKWESLAKATVSLLILAAGLVVVSTVVDAFSEIILPASLVIGLFAASLWVLGKAMQAIGSGFDLMSGGLHKLADLPILKLLGVATGLMGVGAALAIASPFLVMFGIAALIAAPGITNLASGLLMLAGVDGDALASVGDGLRALTGEGKLDLVKFGTAAGIAAPGISDLGNALLIISTGLGNVSEVLNSFKGLDTLKSVVDTINSLDVVKALAFGALSVIGAVSLPAPTSTGSVSTGTEPKPSTLNSPSAVSSNPDVGGDQATPKDAQTPASGGVEKPSSGSGVETALGYQSSILQQLLDSTNNLISVNKDILKYTKVNA